MVKKFFEKFKLATFTCFCEINLEVLQMRYVTLYRTRQKVILNMKTLPERAAHTMFRKLLITLFRKLLITLFRKPLITLFRKLPIT